MGRNLFYVWRLDVAKTHRWRFLPQTCCERYSAQHCRTTRVPVCSGLILTDQVSLGKMRLRRIKRLGVLGLNWNKTLKKTPPVGGAFTSALVCFQSLPAQNAV